MFRDTKEELDRLEAELLAQEEPAQSQEDALEEALLDEILKEYGADAQQEESTVIYKNYSNGYTAYNSDKTDEDLEEFSEAVREPKKDRSILVLSIVALVLMAGILGILAWWIVNLRGLFG